ncbi:hypothetical protein PV10_09077 [Exophiala mesophila]|uniref:Amidase domain-containing protein n=1 Tax=Exophiala mesophila TaxID=212818 RepID=A0A0D1ZMZ8_EXOME|nr:uncharacterized protein PV10_09077 [Exophiala mesophila]KIV88153.1 hypothetical protein PV10_09077 [Exophiala mesophila]
MPSSSKPQESFSVVESSISTLCRALETGRVTSVDLVTQYLHRISRYDCRGPSLNSIPILNPHVYHEALASDKRRAEGRLLGPLDGIPMTVKDSYMVRGMTLASGSPAFQDLMATQDAFVVEKLRHQGAVLLGKTNMPAVAYGGMQRGVYGRAENPYNLDYLAAAFASGSSNGSGASTAASLAAFGMGSETVSSGRSPASNCGLVAYTPSRGMISVRGVLPLYPTCDVLVPHTRSMADLFQVLDVITQDDPVTTGDFWRDQGFVKLPKRDEYKPHSFTALMGKYSLKGLRIAVPSCYIGGEQRVGRLGPIHTATETIKLWDQAKADLEDQGAQVIVVPGFPVVEQYENPTASTVINGIQVPRLPDDWNYIERGVTIARGWEEFLQVNNDPKIKSLRDVDPYRIFPLPPPDHPQIKYAEPTNMIRWGDLTSYLGHTAVDRPEDETTSMYSISSLASACRTLEDLRKVVFEDWLAENRFDLVVFPAAGDVGRADADVVDASAKHAWENGVKYSNGNRALRHLGVPCVTVPMGLLEGKGVPMGLTFCGPAYQDEKLLGWAEAFERATRRRVAPGLTPELSIGVLPSSLVVDPDLPVPNLTLSSCEVVDRSVQTNKLTIQVKGTIAVCSMSLQPKVQIFVDTREIPATDVTLISESSSTETAMFEFSSTFTTPQPPEQDDRNKTEARVARDHVMLVILARVSSGEDKGSKISRPTGLFKLLD